MSKPLVFKIQDVTVKILNPEKMGEAISKSYAFLLDEIYKDGGKKFYERFNQN